MLWRNPHSARDYLKPAFGRMAYDQPADGFAAWCAGNLASNQHGWQWAAGCGTDAVPYFRIFNPTTQGKRFNPDGAYVRHYAPELRNVDAAGIHEPWRLDDGPPNGYPPPIVDHDEERRESLRRWRELRQ